MNATAWCGRLTPAMRAALQQISRATLARRLRDLPSPQPRRLVARPRPGALLTAILVGRYAWNETRPGALEVDCLEHNGGTTCGHYAVTVSLTDIVTGWSARHAVLGRSQRAIHGALATLIAAWPHPPWGLHPDNGAEVLNDQVRRFFELAEEAPIGRVIAKGADRAGVLTTRQVRDVVQFLAEFGQKLRALGAVQLGLLWIAHQDEALTRLPLAQHDLLDLEVLAYLVIPSGLGQGGLDGRLAGQKALAGDVVPAGTL